MMHMHSLAVAVCADMHLCISKSQLFGCECECARALPCLVNAGRVDFNKCENESETFEIVRVGHLVGQQQGGRRQHVTHSMSQAAGAKASLYLSSASLRTSDRVTMETRAFELNVVVFFSAVSQF